MQQSLRKMLRHIFPTRVNGSWIFLAILSVLFVPVVSVAVEKSQATDQIKQIDKEELLRQILGESDNFVYQRENRSDPFLPFIKEKVLQQDKQRAAEEEQIPQEQLPGLQGFEPGQLTLVAIVLKQPSPIAMVQDSVGKGYLVEEGAKIGRTGVVEKITTNTVVIRQTTTTWNQEKLFRRVEMVLRKGGEKPL